MPKHPCQNCGLYSSSEYRNEDGLCAECESLDLREDPVLQEYDDEIIFGDDDDFDFIGKSW